MNKSLGDINLCRLFTRISSGVFGLIFGLLILLRNILLVLFFSYNFSPDSSLYISLGKDFFRTWYISPLVTFPYPFLNALSNSYQSPYLLLFLQTLIASTAGGFFVYVLSKHSRLLALITGVLLIFDLIWGAMARSILTDSLFAALLLASLGILLDHFDRSRTVGLGEIFVSGLLFGITLIFRPSNIFLTAILIPLYLFLVHSWKKFVLLIVGGSVILILAGLINLRGLGTFYILAGNDSYTSTYNAYPMFIYKLFSPENGPKSLELNRYLSKCYPGVDLLSKVDRSEGGAVDSPNNMDLIGNGIIPCVKNNSVDPASTRTIFTSAYLESFLHNPTRFSVVMYQENAVFFRYNDPHILPWLLNASNNYGCTNIPWCKNIKISQMVWSSKTWYFSLYQKVATKIIQVYLAPVGLISAFLPEKVYLPFTVAWFGMVLLLLLVTRGWERFLVMATFVILQYNSITVIAGFGFTERYAAMVTPLHIVLSSILFTVIIRKGYQIITSRRLPLKGGILISR
jgi:hypothetical protein